MSKFPSPKILALDLSEEVTNRLREGGYSINTGSLGTPYKAPRDKRLYPVILNHRLINWKESEIVILDMLPQKPLPLRDDRRQMSPSQEAYWEITSDVVNPRPIAMKIAMDFLSRILNAGGIFIVFAAPKTTHHYMFGTMNNTSINSEDYSELSNWEIDDYLSMIDAAPDDGIEIKVTREGSRIEKFLSKSRFFCKLNKPPSSVLWVQERNKRWTTLATNKYGDAVAVFINAKGEEQAGGRVLLLPHAEDKAGLLKVLLDDWLPELSPALFPFTQSGSWVHDSAYELPEVIRLTASAESIKKDCEQKLEENRKEIENDYSKHGYLHTLLTAQDRELVVAVKKCLVVLGFQQIRDLDEEGFLDEDLWIEDYSPLLIVEIKGVGGHPSDAEAGQGEKRIRPRIRELKRNDINSLTLINHQRNLPPLQRDNENAFRPEQVINAEEQGVSGLMTTWDLFRLTRSFLLNNWSHEDIKEVFYRTGRVNPIPSHYRYIGRTEEHFNKILVWGIRIETHCLHVGKRIALETEVEFLEMEVSSLQVNGNNVEVASPPDQCGVHCGELFGRIRKGMSVYVVD